jgi:hypothetical protein
MTIPEILELLGSAVLVGLAVMGLSGALGVLAGRLLARRRGPRTGTPAAPFDRRPRRRLHWRSPR